MNKTEAVWRAYRILQIWEYIGISCIAAMIGLVIYVGYLQTQLFNCTV